MRTTVMLDDALLARAEQLCGELESSALLKEALLALVQRESAKRLAALGGSDPTLGPCLRRRSDCQLWSLDGVKVLALPEPLLADAAEQIGRAHV